MQTGREMGRTSLKIRNEKNTPSDAERKVMERFEQRKNNGEAVSELEWWQENEDVIAYMKAIPMKGMCAGCHGSHVSPSLKQLSISSIRMIWQQDSKLEIFVARLP